jgi:hypothetical protein
MNLDGVDASQLQKAIKRLNSELFRDLGLTGDEVQTLTALLTKLRRSWSDVERCLTHEEPEPGQRVLWPPRGTHER